MKNVVILCGTNIPINTPRDIANFIISIASIFQKKSSVVNTSVYGLIRCDEFWSLNRVIINEVNEKS